MAEEGMRWLKRANKAKNIDRLPVVMFKVET
jgi:hypothetical protein